MLPTGLKLRVPTVAAVAGLCVASYLLAASTHPAAPLPAASVRLPCNTRQPPAGTRSSSNATALDFSIHHGASDADTAVAAGARARRVPACGARYSEHTPCEGQPWSLRHPRKRLAYRERHCPRRAGQRLRCLVPAPAGYRVPPRWPQSRDAAWYANAPHGELVAEKGAQNWVRREGDVLRFPGGGTMFPHGAGRYVDDIAAAGVPVGAGGAVRTALDTGCGVASWGAHLLSRDVLAMSFAPKDTHEAQVLFALERGIPAMLGVMATKRLPYPARAFDLAHCSRCLIPWNKYNGLYLIEIDRVLRPGGYWVLSGPPVNWERHFRGWKRTPEDLSSELAAIDAIAKSLCWTKVQQKGGGDIAVWQKPINHVACKANDRDGLGKLGFCNASQDPDAGWYVNMEECITPLPEVSGPGDVAGGEVKRWPERLTAPPPRVASGSLRGSITVETFHEDAQQWRRRVDRYKSVSGGLGEKGRYRNLLDANAGLGGFAAALVGDPVWVMNAVPTAAGANTLGVIYERGMIGTYQDWCEAMSTYPRTYDLIHADSLFTMYKDRCEMEDILLEMDRILRPEGTAIFRDDVDILVKIKNLADGMRWDSRITDHEDGPMQREKILVAIKSYWTAGDAS